MSSASLAGPISDRVVKPVALKRKTIKKAHKQHLINNLNQSSELQAELRKE